MSTSTSNTMTSKPSKNAGASFRSSQPKTSTQGESRQENADANDWSKGAKAKEVKGDTNDWGSKKAVSTTTTDAGGRFGGASKKVSTEKIAFRIFQNISISLKPYGGLAKKGEFSIKPGGEDGAIKPFTSVSGRKQFKKVGIRVNYNFKQLLSVRHKFKSMPHDVAQIALVLEEGLGVFEVMEKTTFSLKSDKATSKLRKHRKLPSAAAGAKPTDAATSGSAFASPGADRYGGDDDKVSRLRADTSRSGGSMLKKSAYTAKTQTSDDATPTTSKSATTSPPKESEATTITPPKEKPSLSARSRANREKSKSGVTSPQPTKPATKEQQPVRRPEPARPAAVAAPSTNTASSTTQSLSSLSSRGSPADEKAAPTKPTKKLSSGKGWRAGRSRNEDPMARFMKKITIRLNKITMDNFDSLSRQLVEIFENDIENTEQLTHLVSLIFEKTLQEHVYGPLYAKLCVALSAKNKAFDEVQFKNGQKVVSQVGFKTVLVKVCQNEFEKGKRAVIITDDMDDADRANADIKAKKILMGTMKYIGELYLSDLLPSKIVRVCLKRLVLPTASKPSEDDIEGACTLLATVGKMLDADEASGSQRDLNKFYAKLSSIARTGKYSVRIRMLIQNLVDVRKKSWVDGHKTKLDGPKKLDNKGSKKKKTTMFDLEDIDMFDLEHIMPMGNDDTSDMIQTATMPIASKVVAQSQRQFTSANRYGAQSGNVNAQSGNGKEKKMAPSRRQRTARNSTGRRRMLLETETEDMEEDFDGEEEKVAVRDTFSSAQKPQSLPAQSQSTSGKAGIGRRKSRMSLSASSVRPCSDGKAADEEKLSDLIGDYLGMRANEEATMAAIMALKITDRVGFVFNLIQRAVDDGKGERLSSLLPKLLNDYVVLPKELDAAFEKWFSAYTFEDNPQINQLTPQLVGNLLVDNEISFDALLRWVLLDTRGNQPDDDMLQYYDGDGMRNYIRNSESITKALDLLGLLFKELKEICFENGDFVAELVAEFDFKIDDFINQKDAAKKNEIYAEWVEAYGLKRVGL